MTVAQEISHWQVMSGQMDLQVDPSRNSDLQTLKTITNFSHFDQLVLVVQNLKLVKDFFFAVLTTYQQSYMTGL